MRVRDITDHDLATLAHLNDVEVPRVSDLGVEGLASHLPRCEVTVVAEDDEARIAGFVLALGPGADYDSVNYRWWEARDTDHLYVDRIVVAPHARRRGVAGLLYDTVEQAAREAGHAQVTCEVNVRPRNDASLAFHEARGYVEVGQQDVHGGKRVTMLAKPVS